MSYYNIWRHPTGTVGMTTTAAMMTTVAVDTVAMVAAVVMVVGPMAVAVTVMTVGKMMMTVMKMGVLIAEVTKERMVWWITAETEVAEEDLVGSKPIVETKREVVTSIQDPGLPTGVEVLTEDLAGIVDMAGTADMAGTVGTAGMIPMTCMMIVMRTTTAPMDLTLRH